MMAFRIVAVALGALVCATLAGTSAALARRHDSEPSTGLATIRYAHRPPDFTFETQAGPRALSTFVGRPVVLNFWATWCEPCQAEVAAFAALRTTYGDAVPLVTVSEDETPGAAALYLSAHGVPGAISVDDPDRKIFGLYSVVPIPTTLVLGPDGSVTHVSVGELDWAELRGAVAATIDTGLTLPHAFDTLGRNAGTQGP